MGQKRKLEVGDRVRYSAEFLRSCGLFTGHVPAARGKVMFLESWGGGAVIATVEWSHPDLPQRILVDNLVREEEVPFEGR